MHFVYFVQSGDCTLLCAWTRIIYLFFIASYQMGQKQQTHHARQIRSLNGLSLVLNM